MSIIIVIPAILCLLVLYRSGVQAAFRNVCLPVILLLPTYYYWKVPLLPPLDVAEAAFTPLGIALLYSFHSRWRFTLTDVWLALFILSAAFSEFRQGPLNAAVIAAFTQIASAGFPYVAGKLLVEQQGQRVRIVRRFVFLLFVASILSMYEYVLKQNPFRLVWSKLLPTQTSGWTTQIRWGFGRVAGPYAQSELAGMILLTGLLLSLWLGHWHFWGPRFMKLRTVPIRKSLVITAVLVLTLFMTQARGPWIGSVIAIAIAFIGRSKRTLYTTGVVVGLFLAIGLPAYLATKTYLDAPTTSDEQQTAQYRQELWSNYEPIAVKGELWGWGQDFPKVYLQPSIDNQYLFVWITQGTVGLAVFSLLLLQTLASLLKTGLATKSLADRHFAFSLLGILLGLMFTLATVFLGEQSYEIFFLLVGWSQTLSPGTVTQPAPRPVAPPKPIQVYT